MNYGYITVASAIPQVRVADVDYNVEQIERFVVDADKRGVEILVFPELSVTGYSCQDLSLHNRLCLIVWRRRLPTCLRLQSDAM